MFSIFKKDEDCFSCFNKCEEIQKYSIFQMKDFRKKFLESSENETYTRESSKTQFYWKNSLAASYGSEKQIIVRRKLIGAHNKADRNNANKIADMLIDHDSNHSSFDNAYNEIQVQPLENIEDSEYHRQIMENVLQREKERELSAIKQESGSGSFDSRYQQGSIRITKTQDQ